MRRIGWHLLSFLAASALPLAAHALQIEFCVPDCATGVIHTIQSEPAQTVTDATGVTTTIVPIASFVHQGFTISATVSSQQSGTLQKITFNPTTITAAAGSGCTATLPCKMEIVATSNPCDFPTAKPAGGYPAGVYMMGSFAGAQPAGNGDTIAMTGEASGATSSAPLEACLSIDPATRPVALPVVDDVINATPGTGPANIGVSLPSSCTGSPTCKFMATTLRRAFSTQITETVQQVCADGATSCLTRLRTKLNVEIKTVGNRVTLPLDHVTVNPDPQLDPALRKNPTKQLITQVAPSFSDLDVGHLEVGRNDFLLTAKLRLGSDNPIDPSKEEVFLRVGPFSLTIPPKKFVRLLGGKLFTFVGRIDGREMVMTFARDPRNASLWTFIAGVHDVKLKEVLPAPPLEVPVEIGVGIDTGKDLVTAHFF